MKVHETRANAGHEEDKVMTRKQKAELKTQDNNEQVSKKPKPEHHNGHDAKNGHAAEKLGSEFEEFCKSVELHLPIDQMREILEANGQDSSGSEAPVAHTCLDMLFYGPLEKCSMCDGSLQFDGKKYSCRGRYSEWSSCTSSTKNPQRKEEPTVLPESVKDSPVLDLLKKYEDPDKRPKRDLVSAAVKPFHGMVVSLSGRLSHTHQYWRKEIEKYGGKVSNSVLGVKCLVVSPAERERGGSSKMAEAVEREIPVVREAWLADSIEKQEPQPLEAYEVVADLASVDGKGIPLDKQDPSEEALESISSELKLYGKRGVHKDTMLRDQGVEIFEKDGILYNCAFSLCDLGRGNNDYSIMQLIKVPEKNLHLYFKKSRVGDDRKAEERLEEFSDVDIAVKKFVKLFEEITGNEFEPWEREKKFQKKYLKFYPIDMDDRIDARYGGLGLRQLGIAAAHTKLDPLVAHLVKILCSQEIYRYAVMEMGLDSPDLPTGMLSDFHLKRSEEVLLDFIDKFKSAKEQKVEALWSDFSQRWFTLMPSSRPFIFKGYNELADHAAAALETVRDITVASHLIGDLTGSTLDDPLQDRYKKMGCSISPLEKESDDYKMILNYLEKTYEPVKLGDLSYGVSVSNIYEVALSADSSYDELKKLPNKVLLWCGTRSSNLLRHLQKGFLPSICSLPVPGYMFGKSIVCSDAAAEAARYGFTAVDRPEGFLVLAVASLGEEILEFQNPPEDIKSLEEKKAGVKGLGRKKPDETEHTVWKDDIKVPCGRLIPSGHENSVLEYNEYAVYDPKQVSIRFLVGVKFEEKDVVMDVEE